MSTNRLSVQSAGVAALAPYGCLIEPLDGGVPQGHADARLDLARGTPRFYVMRLPRRDLTIRQITRHVRVTQCLSALGGHEWLMVLAPPDEVDRPDAMPDTTRLAAFRFSGQQALALHRGTWHAGPLFKAPQVDFVNLELSDTNEADHQTVRLDPAFVLDLGDTA